MPTADRSLPAFARMPETETVAAAIDLAGTWQFKAVDEDEWLPAVVPGTVHSDLIRAGRLEDPFYRDNELKSQWVERKEWEYRRIFEAAGGFLAHDRIFLQCLGLDTIAEVYLNGERIAVTENMFIEHEFDVKRLLRTGENEIRLVFRSILAWNKERIAAEPRVVWGGVQGMDSEKGTSFFVRKAGADFGWDWGPRLLPSGIWRPIRLAAYDAARVKDLLIRQDLGDPQRAVLDIKAETERFDGRDLLLEARVLHDGAEVARAAVPVSGAAAEMSLAIEHPKLWWPNGLGEQPLYTVIAELRQGSGLVHARKVRIGLRTVEMVQEDCGRGRSFGFRVNGRTVFCKGGNWVPAGAMRDVLTEEHYLRLLQSCKDVGMNMIRLWGGGQYEAEIFYDYCDENGLMLWHDFMFAVGPHIAEENHLANIRREIEGVLRRLRHHPSIALWCGNNEQESSMPRWSRQFAAANWENYDRIFHEAIPAVAADRDPDRPYWPSSPHHPLDRERKVPDAETASGDAHVWEVWHGGEAIDWYARHSDYRFVSEFGLQSLPPLETIRSFTAPEDRRFPSRILDLHNKGGKKSLGNEDSGQLKLAWYVASEFKLPGNLADWVYLSQLAQGEAVRTAVEAYRRNYPRTTGALYWQINDNWPCVSWSGLDYFGRWKALQYMARRFYAPVLVCARITGSKAEIWGINDGHTGCPARLEWTLARFDGGTVRGGELETLLPANGSAPLAVLDLAEAMGEDPGHTTYRNTDFEQKARHYLAYRLAGPGGELSRNVSFFAPLKYATLADPGLEYALRETGGRLTVTLAANAFAAHVELGLREGYARFSDNFFHLLPGETREIEVVESDLPAAAVRKLLYARSLVDTL